MGNSQLKVQICQILSSVISLMHVPLVRQQNIVRSFTKPDGTLRLVFATVVFSLGLDSPNVRHIVHWSSPDDLDMYVQESGRAG